jgi:HEAT repeat protein
MTRRFLTIVTLMTSYCAFAEAQELAVRYYPEKLASPVGEPIVVLTEFTNISSRTIRFDESPCLQSFEPVVPVAPAMTERLYGCTAGGTAGSCAGGFVELKPGEKLLRRYLLPDGIEPNAPGSFQYEAEREITFYATEGFSKEADRQQVSETFTVRAVQADQTQLEADYAPLIADLQSPDARRSSIARMALTEHPQRFLEPLILKLSQSAATMNISIEGLRKLGTDQAKDRLAELTDSHYDESMRQQATTALAELGDRSYCGLMLQIMNLRQGYTSDIAARGAGLLCGERAIPQLVSLLSSKQREFPAYDALGNTGSRAGVPILIELLRSHDSEVRRAASDALYTLTHRNAGVSSEDNQNWASWWALQGKTSQIFDPTQCP